MSKGGALRSENVGMSNHNSDEMSEHRKPKVSLAMKISQGLGDPKEKPKGESNGQPVNIPAHRHFFLKVTEVSNLGVLLDLHLYLKEKSNRIIKLELRFQRSKRATFPEKFSRAKGAGIVPKTDTGGLA